MNIAKTNLSASQLSLLSKQYLLTKCCQLKSINLSQQTQFNEENIMLLC